jgi:natural product biosynthesis luciferase-like monooxygenase protein
VLTKGSLPPPAVPPGTELIDLDAMRDVLAAQPAGRCRATVRGDDTAYVIYTSGSTGRPKGVQVEHRNVVNFFAGMDARIPVQGGDAWLAVTSLSFDISVLEIFWSLARGLQVVVFRERRKEVRAVTSLPDQPMDFSLFYFSSDVGDEAGPARYRLLLEGARFADQHGFCAVWTPERHFHTFGGLYPDPAVTGAAVAAVTERVQIRAGSVVLPLHNPIRVAEAWQVIDNLSNGRVGLSMASGWQPNDFVLMPENFGKQKQTMFRDIEIVRRLWRGEAVEFTNPAGKKIALRTLPRPVQPELPLWVTTAGNPETYRMAGAIGANLLTHLLGQSVEQLAPKLALYRDARRQAGFDPDAGIVSLMLHTFVGDGDVRGAVRGPLKQYLGTSFDLLKEYAWAFPAFHKPNGVVATDTGTDFSGLTDEERDALLEHAFERYFATSGLFGSVDEALAMVDRLKAIGVDEIACLLDYGVPTELALQSLPALDELRRRSNQKPLADVDRWSVPNLIRERAVTHLQCTPSMMRMLLADPYAREAFARLRCVMVGGEALSPELSKDIRSATGARLLNMYGPTETTVWSSVHEVRGDESLVPLGEPIANTLLFVLDRRLQPLPDGVPGELCIGGAGVARGYLGRPELTAERFVELQLPEFAAPLRVYRTGDLVRRAPGGALEFLGRLDHQVKVRGYRIELGEIENVLERQPQVRECVVVARTPAGGEPMLCAYVVARGEFDEAALRAVLKKELPEFMVPQAFVALPDLPRTPNQKVDRKALPEPRLQVRGSDRAGPADDVPQEGLPPELVQQIAAVWQKHLGQDRIGPRDNFFDLGGHSLLVVRVHRDLQQNVAPNVSLTDLYRYPTVGALARYLAGGSGAATAQTSTDRADRRRAAMARRRG